MDKKIEAKHLALVEAAARGGARTVTKRVQVVRDAGEQARGIFIRRVITGGAGIGDIDSWAFRAGANAARRIAADSPMALAAASDLKAAEASVGEAGGAPIDIGEAARRAGLARIKEILTAHQLMIESVLMRPGRTQGRAAQLLGLDRRNLARTFARALARVEHARNGPLPTS